MKTKTAMTMSFIVFILASCTPAIPVMTVTPTKTIIPNTELEVDKQYLDFRNIYLSLDPSQFSVDEQAQMPETWGVMIDIGFPELFFTVATLSDGTTSVYAGEGAARIGFGEHPTIAQMSKDLLSVATNCSVPLKNTQEFSLPPIGIVRYYIFKKDGKYMTESTIDHVTKDRSMEEIIRDKDCHALMFRIGWAIIDEIRVIKQESN